LGQNFQEEKRKTKKEETLAKDKRKSFWENIDGRLPTSLLEFGRKNIKINFFLLLVSNLSFTC
jgi:hypothetical protein